MGQCVKCHKSVITVSHHDTARHVLNMMYVLFFMEVAGIIPISQMQTSVGLLEFFQHDRVLLDMLSLPHRAKPSIGTTVEKPKCNCFTFSR